MVVSLKGPPVGIPLVFQNLKADEGNPPKHPLPQYEQHDNKYNGDIHNEINQEFLGLIYTQDIFHVNHMMMEGRHLIFQKLFFLED